ncbi:MAG: HAD-IIIA family hydrolase [Bacteroidales bacterium]
MANYKAKLKNIKAFAFDVDGVMTDGSILSTPDGDLLRTFNSKDGLGLRLAVKRGFPVAIITGGHSPSILNRAKVLGIIDVYESSRNKVPDLKDFCEKYNLKPEEVAFMGDDLPDMPAMDICGLSACPADAVDEVKGVCDFVSLYPGGRGCVRNLIEQVLKIHDRWYFDPKQYDKEGIR